MSRTMVQESSGGKTQVGMAGGPLSNTYSYLSVEAGWDKSAERDYSMIVEISEKSSFSFLSILFIILQSE